MQNSFIKTILNIEKYCKENKINHLFVGGVSFGGLLNEATMWDINLKKREIILKNYNNLINLRTDKSLKDIDLIIFEKDKLKIKRFKKDYEKFKNQPFLSFENAIYFPHKINSFFQFVTSIEIDKSNHPYLIFGNVKEKISWASLETWKIILDKNLSYSVRNPIADYFAYQIRSPGGIKKKDIKKLSLLKKLFDEIISLGEKNKIDFLGENYYQAWIIFIKKIKQSNNLNIKLKRNIMKFYWNTIGEYLAYGKGFGKYLNFLSNKFTG